MDTIIKLQQIRLVYNFPRGPVWNPKIMKSTNASTIPHTPTNTFSKNRFSCHHTLPGVRAVWAILSIQKMTTREIPSFETLKKKRVSLLWQPTTLVDTQFYTHNLIKENGLNNHPCTTNCITCINWFLHYMHQLVFALHALIYSSHIIKIILRF